MNRVDFIALIQNPGQATPAQLHELEKVVAAFPYCQNAHLLIAKVAHDQKAMLADQKLKLAAAYAIDRSQLKNLIFKEEPSEEQNDNRYTLQDFTPVTPEPLVNQSLETPAVAVEQAEVVKEQPVVAETKIEIKEEVKQEVKPLEPAHPPKDPELASMISHREKLMEELERKLEEIKKNREKFQQTVNEEPVIASTPVAVAPEVIATPEAVTPIESVAIVPPAPVIPAHQETPVVAEIKPETSQPETIVSPIIPIAITPTVGPASVTPENPVVPITPIVSPFVSVNPIASILSSVEEKNKPVLPPNHEELPDTVKAMYQASVEPIIENIGIHVLDEILRMDEKQQLENEDLSIFKKTRKTPTEPDAEIPTPLPPLPPEEPIQSIPSEHPVKPEHSLVPLNVYGKLEGHIASDNDTDNNSVDPGQADMLTDYLDFINTKRLRNRRDPKKVDAIIDRFIKEEPIISRLSPNQEEAQPDLAEKSYTPPAGMVSENFARILLTQGKKDKAIKVYEELILKNPEKKDYFANLIEQIRKGE